jgi:hypothetical protein
MCGTHRSFRHVKNFEDKMDGDTAFETLATKHPECRDRWILDDKWVDVIRTNYFTPPSKEKEEELKFGRKNMVRAIGSQWQHHRGRLHCNKPRWHGPAWPHGPL